MRPEEIVAGLRKKKKTQREIAQKCGKSIPLVNCVIHRRPGNMSNNRKVRVAIARTLGLKVDIVFKEHDDICNYNTILTNGVGAVNGKP